MSTKPTREYFFSKYGAEIRSAEDNMTAREYRCLDALMGEGITEYDFISIAISIEASNYFKRTGSLPSALKKSEVKK